MTFDSVTGRPHIFRQVIGTEESIEQREVDGEIDVDGFLVGPVVPVVKLRRDEQLVDERQSPANIGVNQGGADVGQQDVDLDGQWGESESSYRNRGDGADEQYFHKVHTRTGHPIHALSGMMDSMEIPEPRDTVEGAVCPVLEKIRRKHDDRDLDDKREATYPAMDGAEGREVPEKLSGGLRQESQRLDHEAADQDVEKIFAPFVAEKSIELLCAG